MAGWGWRVLAPLTLVLVAQAADPKPAVVVRVNSKEITTADVEFAARKENVSADKLAEAEPRLIEGLIDDQLIRAFLTKKRIEAPAEELQRQIASAKKLAREGQEDPDKLLLKIGYNDARLKSELGLPLAWMVYARLTITNEQLKAYFELHRQELDGSQCRGRQIFFKLTKPVEDADERAKEIAMKKRAKEIATKRAKLVEIRDEILAGQSTFADAAKKYSEAPSAKNGGDVGLFGWHGKLPPEVSAAVFQLKIDDISEPIVSTLGVHLIQITEQHPGDYSLEDVRSVILERLAKQLWKTTVAKERESAKIVWEKK